MGVGSRVWESERPRIQPFALFFEENADRRRAPNSPVRGAGGRINLLRAADPCVLRIMGHAKGKDNVKKRQARRKKNDRLQAEQKTVQKAS